MDELPNGFTGFRNKNRVQEPSVDMNFQYSRSHSYQSDGAVAPLTEEKMDAIPDAARRWAWMEVDRSAIQHNVLATRQLLEPNTRLLAVVKSDAYGHGAVEVAKTALTAGASYLAVATVDEGIQLRKGGVNAPILILSEPPISSIPLLLFYKIMPSVYTPDFAVAYGELADAHGLTAPYHLAINTGMNRIGVRWDETLELVRAIDFHRALKLEGCFTHFATADAMETFGFESQIKHFVEAMRALEQAGIDPGIVHCDNSAALYRYPKTHFDMVRMGISLYGYQPAPDTDRIVKLRPAMSIKARITNVIDVPISEGVSYGFNYISPGSVKVCTVPVGYADGLVRMLSGEISFAYQNMAVRQVGNICMDQCMFEVDMRPRAGRPRLNPQIGDEVLIAGPHPSVDCSIETMSTLVQTIPYEIICGFSRRLKRRYV